MSVYQVSNFDFSYPFSQQKIKLNGIFCLEHGECLLLQGASGSGKSTILAALKGLLPNLISGTFSGSILFHGQDITTLNEQELLSIGYLQQNPANQLICRDVFSELAFGLENQGLDAASITSKIQDICREFNLSHLLEREVSSLSGGEQQKINLLAILLLDPEILLLDEPTAFLDPDAAYQIMEMIKRYIQNKTVVIVEHNLVYLRQLINRSIYIDATGDIHEQDLNQISWGPKLPAQSCKFQTHSQAKPLISLKNLSFGYSQHGPIFKNLAFSLFPGQVVALKGANGSGKSTLLKILAGITPCPNMVYWQDQDLASLAKRKLWQQLSLVWQNPETHFLYATVSDEVDSDLLKLSDFNLSQQASNNPFCLSEGQKRRLSLAITLNPERKLILLDEPTFGQDFANKLQLTEIINRMATAGTSFFIVSHDLDFIAALTTQVFEIQAGKLSIC